MSGPIQSTSRPEPITATQPATSQPKPATTQSPAVPVGATDRVKLGAAAGSVPGSGVPLATSAEAAPAKQAAGFQRKGNLTLSWGYNKSAYAPSTIHFKGDNHDFTLHNVRASDRPSFKNVGDFATNVWKTDLTIPQYNFRIGYYLTDKTSLSVGIDHMKYVVDNGQTAMMSGTIDGQDVTGPTTISPDGPVQNFEHTDGFNLIDVEVGHTHTLAASANGKHAVSVIGTVGAGVMIPRSDVTMFGERLNNRFHVAGYGVSGSVGVRADVFKYAFVEGKLKAGYSEITNALTIEGGRASHNVLWAQPSISVGVNVPIGNRK